MFRPDRLIMARQRRQMTAKALADAAGVSAVTMSRLERGENDPDEDTIRRLSRALHFPRGYFFKEPTDPLVADTVSFRSFSKMSAKEKNAALGAGHMGMELADWVSERFKLPEPDLIDLSSETDPEAAAIALRQYWSLGEKPIGNMIKLLEAKGVRVFSLAENTASVNAFSFWRDDVPFVFLNTFKTSESSIFDSAHELGHLILHRHAGTQPLAESSRQAEREADAFASAFLIPKKDVRAALPRPIYLEQIIKAKKRWRVSAMALNRRLYDIGNLTDWQYKQNCIALTKRGYRKSEPHGVERESSTVWRKVLRQLWSEKLTISEIALMLEFPQDEVESLIWALTSDQLYCETTSTAQNDLSW